MLGNIHSIETMGLFDGPGIRVVVFFQGCPLRCIYCHNPDTWFKNEKCLMKPSELVDIILKYKNYFSDNGGVTFSGGEPLLQSEFLIEVLKICKENNIHTCLDTSGIGGSINEEILKNVDLVLFDVKAITNESYKKITGFEIDESLKFLKLCEKLNKKLWIRQVIVPGINDNEEDINNLKKFIKKINNVEKIELLPYHTMGENKYKELGLKYKLNNTPPMDKERCKKLEEILKK